MKTSGQIAGQVVIYLIAVIIFSLVLIYGYKSINTIQETRQQVEIVEFSESLKGAIKRISLDYGSVKKVDLKVPSVYKEVCFIDLDAFDRANSATYNKRIQALAEKSALIADVIQSNPTLSEDVPNIFTIPASETPIRTDAIEVESGTDACPGLELSGNGFLCIITQGGKLSLRLEGRGDEAWVCPWPANI